jgi:Glycine rich protein
MKLRKHITTILGASTLFFCGLHEALAETITFNYTGSYTSWVVPLEVTSIAFDLTGASGGNAYGAYTVYGGLGGTVSGTLNVTPGETLYFFVGGWGDDSNATAIGGFNGGGSGSVGNSSGGGGATDIRVGGVTLTDRIAVAGGGGGASSTLGYGGGGGNMGPFNTNPGVGSDTWKGGGGGGFYGGAEGLFNGRGGSNNTAVEVANAASIDGADRLDAQKVNGSASITTVPEPSVCALLGLTGAAALIYRRNQRK